MKQPLPPCIKVVQIDYRFCAGPLYCTEFSSYWKTNQAGSYLIDRELSGNCVWPLYWKDIFCPLSQTIDVYGPFIAPESQAAIMFKSAFFEAALCVAIASGLPSQRPRENYPHLCHLWAVQFKVPVLILKILCCWSHNNLKLSSL